MANKADTPIPTTPVNPGNPVDPVTPTSATPETPGRTGYDGWLEAQSDNWWNNIWGVTARKNAMLAEDRAAAQNAAAEAAAGQVEGDSRIREAEAQSRAKAAELRAQGDDKAAQALEAQADQYRAQSDQYGQNVAKSIGGSAGDYAKLAEQSAKGLAAERARDVSTQAAKQQIKAGRTAGLNAGQAAMLAGQGATDVYGNTYQQGIESGLNQYGIGTSAQQQQQQQLYAQQQSQQQAGLARRGLATTQRGQGLQEQQLRQAGLDTRAGMANTRFQSANAANQAAIDRANASSAADVGVVAGVGDAIKTGAQIAMGMPPPSDKNLKTNIKSAPKGRLEEILAKVTPVQFNYKNEGDDKQRQGILAQDLEQTSLKDNVVEMEDGKHIDAGQQTLSNLSLIIELAGKVRDMERELAQYKGKK